MNKRIENTGRLLGEVLVAALLSAGMAMLFSEMLDLAVNPAVIYGTAAGLAAVVCLLTYSRASAWVTLLALVAAALAAVVLGWRPIERLMGILEAARTHAPLADYTQDLMIITLVLLYATVYIFAHQRGSAYMLLAFLLALLGVGWFFTGTSTSIHILPALIAVSAMFARDGEHGEQLKALVSVSLIAALLACALVPGEGVKNRWLETASQKTLRTLMRVFNIERDNLSERRSFTIGYDGWLNRREAFGGPAFPQNGALMRVQTEDTAYLRGSIRYVYDNRAWVDEDNRSKAGKIKRYMMGGIEGFLYRDEYERAFDLDKNLPEEILSRQTIHVEVLKDTVSWSIFTPNRTENVETASEVNTYYNNIGEQFFSRALIAGDSYTLTVQRLTAGEEALGAVLDDLRRREDKNYASVLLMNRELPSGIETQLYSLTYDIIAGLETPYEKACALRDWLKTNGKYTLNAAYPPDDRDFVSWFVLDERAGYCTFYAAAMTVMARIAGLPSRYVEGYLAIPDENGECLITGEQAHAWTEIYFENCGWLTFDATPPRTHDGEGNQQRPGDNSGNGQTTPSPVQSTPTPTPSPTPQPTAAPTREPDPEDENDGVPDLPTPTPEPPVLPDDPGDNTPWNEPEKETEPDKNSGAWVRIAAALFLLILIALAVLAVRARVRATHPANMARKEKNAENRLMIWYRAMLTALSAQGLDYETGDTPLSFAENAVNRQLCEDGFIAFSRAVSESRYSGREAEAGVYRLAQRVYRDMERRMKLINRVKWLIRRVFHGIGSIDPVP